MRSKFTNFILFIVMILLIGVIVLFATYIYETMTDVNNTNSPEFIYSINSNTTNNEEKEQNTVTTNQEQLNNIDVEEVEIGKETNERYYYEQLTDVQKSIYDGLLENKENMYNGTYKIQYGGIFSDILKQEGGNQKLGQDYQSAVESFLYDNPDVFYVDANKLYLSVETSKTILKTTYNVYIGPAENKTYYVDGFTSEMQVKSAMKKIENIKDDVISKLTGNTYRDILKIHDFLVESVDYDQEYKSIGCYNIYGALIDKKCVCEGYAKALKYLLNAANIPCVIAQGSGMNSSGKIENHAWNCVYLNEKWYYIDATWNDPIIIGQGSVAKSIQYKYFLKGSKTFNKDHTLSYQFSEGGRIYRYPAVQEYDYE